MGEVSTIGLDIAKSVFQVHGVDVAGAVVIRKRVSRAKVLEYFGELPQCLVGIEACPSAHHWGRELQALGHTVRLIPPSYVKAYLKRSKNDANDAAAICEAVTRPSMRFVPIKTGEGFAVDASLIQADANKQRSMIRHGVPLATLCRSSSRHPILRPNGPELTRGRPSSLTPTTISLT